MDKRTAASIKYLVFEGGGGKGAAYLPVIEALEDKKVTAWDQEYKGKGSGTFTGAGGASAGAITAYLLCMGYRHPEIRKLMLQDGSVPCDFAKVMNKELADTWKTFPDPDDVDSQSYPGKEIGHIVNEYCYRCVVQKADKVYSGLIRPALEPGARSALLLGYRIATAVDWIALVAALATPPVLKPLLAFGAIAQGKPALDKYGHIVNPATISNLVQFGGLTSGVWMRIALAKMLIQRAGYDAYSRHVAPVTQPVFNADVRRFGSITSDKLFDWYKKVKFKDYIHNFKEPPKLPAPGPQAAPTYQTTPTQPNDQPKTKAAGDGANGYNAGKLSPAGTYGVTTTPSKSGGYKQSKLDSPKLPYIAPAQGYGDPKLQNYSGRLKDAYEDKNMLGPDQSSLHIADNFLSAITFEKFYAIFGKDLRVVGTNLTCGRCMLFSRHLTPNFPVVDAVAISGSFPILFKPIYVEYRTPNGTNYTGWYCDGGLYNNLPIEAFNGDDMTIEQLADCALDKAVLGFNLVDGANEPDPDVRTELADFGATMSMLVDGAMSNNYFFHKKREVEKQVFDCNIGLMKLFDFGCTGAQLNSVAANKTKLAQLVTAT